MAKAAFYPAPPAAVVKGDVAAALAASPHTVTGTVTSGGQRHMYMETQNTVAEVVDGCLHIRFDVCSTLALDFHPFTAPPPPPESSI